MITGIRGVNIKVRDQDRSASFWTEQVGLKVVSDVVMPDFAPRRWLETAGPSGNALMILHWPVFDEVEFFSGITFTCDDIHKTYEELTAKGVEFVSEPVLANFGWWASFRDPDGNVFVLRQEKG